MLNYVKLKENYCKQSMKDSAHTLNLLAEFCEGILPRVRVLTHALPMCCAWIGSDFQTR